MDKKLNIAFVWHMHQPLYKDPFTGEHVMPWVLFHGTKDYYDMVSILDEFPDIHQTFNLVPSLIEQLNDYAMGRADDTYRNLSLKPASELTREDRIFILTNFFQANWDNAIRPLERYRTLLKKRGPSNAPDEIESVLRYFPDQDYLDLQVLFNLVWIDPMLIAGDPFLSELYGKAGHSEPGEQGYTEGEKLRLLDSQIEIIRKILPKYAQMMRSGMIEVSTTPYYHPIMPLLFDTDSALVAMPGATLPDRRFSHPEDVTGQLKKSVAFYKDTFGREPDGMWPSEGSVSTEIIPMVAAEGFSWIASDEEILSNTIKRPIRRDHEGRCCDAFLYRPYCMDAGGEGKISVVFRDHVLSDLIGFHYAKMDPDEAALDLVSRLLYIRGLTEDPDSHLVSIILDGENAWETYRNDGRDFLLALYSRLSGHPHLRCVTVNEFLTSTPDRDELEWIYPGSWINHDFGVWIGHPEMNTAWDFISDAREALLKFQDSLPPSPNGSGREAVDEAWDAIYAAEGSDWFWWYGDDHSSSSDEQFDLLFRRYIKKVYALIDAEPPVSLDIPIISREKGIRPSRLPVAFIDPVIDGEVTNYFEWLGAGILKRGYSGSSMHRELEGGVIIEAIRYGFSKEELFFRFDYPEAVEPSAGVEDPQGQLDLTLNFIHPSALRVSAVVKGRDSSAAVFTKTPDGWAQSGTIERIASESVVELAIPLSTIGAEPSDEIRFLINIDAGERGLERWPVKGFVIIDVPSVDFELENWCV